MLAILQPRVVLAGTLLVAAIMLYLVGSKSTSEAHGEVTSESEGDPFGATSDIIAFESMTDAELRESLLDSDPIASRFALGVLRGAIGVGIHERARQEREARTRIARGPDALDAAPHFAPSELSGELFVEEVHASDPGDEPSGREEFSQRLSFEMDQASRVISNFDDRDLDQLADNFRKSLEALKSRQLDKDSSSKARKEALSELEKIIRKRQSASISTEVYMSQAVGILLRVQEE